jgi:hypothetical protein
MITLMIVGNTLALLAGVFLLVSINTLSRVLAPALHCFQLSQLTLMTGVLARARHVYLRKIWNGE